MRKACIIDSRGKKHCGELVSEGLGSGSERGIPRVKRQSFARGFDRGNYGNAYESQDWDSWYAEHSLPSRSKSYQEGMLVGFFSSYELDEIGDEVLREEVAALRVKWGEEL